MASLFQGVHALPLHRYVFLPLLDLPRIMTATALSFATPIIVTILSIPILKQSIGMWRWFAVLIGFLAFSIIDPSGDLFSYYSILPLGAAFGYGMSMVLVKIFPKKVPSALIQGQSQISSLFFS